MLGKGKSSGVINEATNQYTNEQLTKAVDYMSTKEYQKTRDATDVIPTHKQHKADDFRKDDRNLQVYDPEAEKAQERAERADDGEDEDDDLAFLRERRMAMLKQQHEKQLEWIAKQHGTYREIQQDGFFNTVVRDKGGSDQCVVHFFHNDFERCKVMDARLQDLAPSFMSAKFVKVDVQKAPFLVDKLKVTMLPCVVIFRNDVAIDRIVGFDDLGNSDDFSIETLRDRIGTPSFIVCLDRLLIIILF